MSIKAIPPFQSPRRTGRDKFYVRVNAKSDDAVELEVFRTVRDPGHGDFDFEKSFALQLLWVFPNLLESTTHVRGAEHPSSGLQEPLTSHPHPLAERVPFETFLDIDATMEASEEIIAEFEMLECRNYPLDEDALALLDEDAYTAFWNDASNAPYARFAVRVHEAKWIEHLAVGLDYESPARSLD